ncbi:Hypothetical protein D9617_1g085950 [Elsinoe fawcettii]|nr:Hypothetical protein D9617_1g085950 [Elsinoe fawcettii]
MANQAPNPKELTSWQDAFDYPVPVVRKLEQQLRTNINDNREKVRSLVGSSYRDLLGTADRIIAMNDEMQSLEEVFADIGQKCNSRAINKLATNHASLRANQSDEQITKKRPAAEAALLQACLSVCQRHLKDNGSPLLAARLLLLGRLLQNSASKTPQGARIVSNQRLKLNTLRTRLLSSIDREIGKPGLSRTQMLDLLLAYALVTSSSLADVFRYILQVRQQSLADLCEQKKHKAIISAVDLYFITLEQVRSIFPKRLSETIERTTGPQLLSDPDLRSAMEWDLDIYERWISKDIRNYVPWLRNNDLQADVLTKVLNEWSSAASTTIIAGFESLLQTSNRPSRISKLRESAIRHLLESNTKAAGVNKESLLMSVRSLFRARLSEVISSRASSIRHTVSILLDGAASKQYKVDGLWDPALASLDLRQGASQLRNQIILRSNGHDDSLTTLSEELSSWSTKLDELRKSIKEMQSLRWAESLDLDADLDEDAGRYDQLFSKEDTARLSDHLSSEIDKALSKSLSAVDRSATTITTNEQTSSTTVSSRASYALYLVRLLRVISPYLTSTDLVSSASGTAITLHALLAEEATSRLKAASGSADLEKSLFAGNPPLTLWSGPPPLPIQPGSRSFRLLRDLSKTMNNLGSDVWVNQAVIAVKTRVRDVVAAAIEDLLANSEELNQSATNENELEGKSDSKNVDDAKNETDGSEQNETKGEIAQHTENNSNEAGESPRVTTQQKLTQALFDALYLREALHVPHSSTDNKLNAVIKQLQTKAELEESSLDRLIKSAQTYHKRTYLLFGILANS